MKGVLLHGLLAAFGLTVAYLVWTDDSTPRQATSEVPIASCDDSRVTEIEYEGEDTRVLLERRGEGDEKYWWIVSTRRPEEGEETRTSFVGGPRVDEYLGLIAPFMAKRSLGTLEAERLAEFELDEAQADQLTIHCGDREQVYRVGMAVHGSNDRYVQNAQGGAVYLVAARVIGDLQSSSLLMQRPMHRFESTEIETITVSALGRSRRLRQRNRLEPQAAQWVDDAQPDVRNELYGNWLVRINQLTASEYLPPDSEPGSDLEVSDAEAIPVLRMEYRDDGDDLLGFTELVRVHAGDAPQYYARSEATRVWVKVRDTVARQVERDARPVVGLEPAPEEAPTAGETTQESSTESTTSPEPEAPAVDPHAGHGH